MSTLGTATQRHRLHLMRQLMDQEDVDALAFTTAAYFQFATNFSTDVRPWERPVVCVVPGNGTPFVILNELSLHHWRFGTEAASLWVSDAAFYTEHLGVREPGLPLITQWTALLATDSAKRVWRSPGSALKDLCHRSCVNCCQLFAWST